MKRKLKNFQQEFTLEDIKIAKDVKSTYNCGMSRIALKAPMQCNKIHRPLGNGPKDTYALVVQTTLKLYYAIQVWNKAVLISQDSSNGLADHWGLHWEEGNGAFNEIVYNDSNKAISSQQLMRQFWNLLEHIADSGDISVVEGFTIGNLGIGSNGTKIKCDLVIDAETASSIKVDNVFTYPYNKKPISYRWQDIKDMFCELSLDQLRLTMPEKLHRHTKQDDILLKACFDWDIDQINLALQNGANVNCLNESGESPLQLAVEYFRDFGKSMNTQFSDEENLAIESRNEKKCKEVVELLINNGADVNLFGYDGLTPLVCAYYSRSPEMIRFLLEKGADPNVNCFLEDIEYWPRLKNVKSTILDCIDNLMFEDYNEKEQEIERLIRAAGGRQFVWDFAPWNNKNIGKYVVVMHPSKSDTHLFSDNSQRWIGTDSSLTVEDAFGHSEEIDLTPIGALAIWSQEYRDNQNVTYDWDKWYKHGLDFARQIAALIPDSVALFYKPEITPKSEYIRIVL